jgi:electron transport complex protein RnfC
VQRQKKQQKLKATQAQSHDVVPAEVEANSKQAQTLKASTENITHSAVNDKKAQVAAAIAKAKAKKQANAKLEKNTNKTVTDENDKVDAEIAFETPQTISPNDQQVQINDDKKQRIAAAIAKAKKKSKAKKQAQPLITQILGTDDKELNKTVTKSSFEVDSDEPGCSKNANEKTELTNDTASNDLIGNDIDINNNLNTSTHYKTDEKSARIAATIAKAKAKKKAKQAQLENKQS